MIMNETTDDYSKAMTLLDSEGLYRYEPTDRILDYKGGKPIDLNAIPTEKYELVLSIDSLNGSTHAQAVEEVRFMLQATYPVLGLVVIKQSGQDIERILSTIDAGLYFEWYEHEGFYFITTGVESISCLRYNHNDN
jgi:hypothetical protein